MEIPVGQLSNLPDIQVMNVEVTEREIKCDIESTRGYSIRRRFGQKATRRPRPKTARKKRSPPF